MQALGSTLSQVRNRPVDVVLLLSRLDDFRVDASDVQASSLSVVSPPRLRMQRYDSFCSGLEQIEGMVACKDNCNVQGRRATDTNKHAALRISSLRRKSQQHAIAGH